MMTDMTRSICTTSDFPVSPMAFKRAILKPAPTEFTVEVLTPAKQGSQFSYGVRVCPIFRSRCSSDSRSMSSYSEYEIWRRWEDCLDFQDTLEREYEMLSRDKVTVLKRGARGKKRKDEPDSPYTLHNAAASFESLPEGPDPREVITNVHKLIPSLNPKATVFRVSRSTLQQREDEFAAMIRALFNPSPDAPVLLQELRNCSAVRDFFALWRRDQDLQKKLRKEASRLFHSNYSTSSLSTSFSTTFSTSSTPQTPSTPPTPSLTSLLSRPNTPGFLSRRSLFGRSVTDCNKPAPASAPPATRGFKVDDIPSSPSPPPKNTSHGRCHSGPTGQLLGSMRFTDELLLRDEPPIIESPDQRHPFSQIPAPHSAPPPSTRKPCEPSQPSGTRADDPLSGDELPRPLPRLRNNRGAMPGYRNARIFLSPPTPSLLSLRAEQLDSHVSVNASDDSFSLGSQTPLTRQDSRPLAQSQSVSPRSPTRTSPPADSCTSFLSHAGKRSLNHDANSVHDFEQDDNGDKALSDSPVEQSHLPGIAETHESGFSSRIRLSTFSIASLRTELSADGVLPLHLRPHTESRMDGTPHGHGSRPHPHFEELSPGCEDFSSAYITDLSDVRFSTMMGSLEKTLPDFVQRRGKGSLSSMSSMGSFNSSIVSSSQAPRDEAFAVKAVYKDCVIVFRAERAMSLAAIRERIRERFALHERIPLAEGFGLACLPLSASAANAAPVLTWALARGDSVASTVSDSDVAQPQLLRTEADWQAIIRACNGKVALRVLDAESTAS